MKGVGLWFALLAPLVDARASPTVDLGYTLHQAEVESTTNGAWYLNFTNVRYGTGRRFQPPVSPPVNRTVQTAGAYNIRCPQGEPAWLSMFGQPTGNLTGVPPVTAGDLPPIDPSTHEDCLFLDVFVPEQIFNARRSRNASVIVWIHGGGYVTGWKSIYTPGPGLIETAQKEGRGTIFVSINYRLGLFGFLTDPDSNEVTRNLGLRDQQCALQWVRKYIHLFGGNPNAVTVMGESAGGGSIMYHLTSGNDSSQPSFQRAIIQSPFTINIPSSQQKSTLQKVFQRANVSSLEHLKKLPTKELQIANALIVGNAKPYGTFVFGPVIDEPNFPGYPPVLLEEGHYNHDVSIIAGHNTNEGKMFASPSIHTDKEFTSLIASIFPSISPNALSVISDELYPHDFSGKHGYIDQTGRVASTIQDSLIICNAYFLGEAFRRNNASFKYEFSVPPALHADDLAYTFYAPGTSSSDVNATLAGIMQSYFVRFSTTGNLCSPHQEAAFQADDVIQNFNISTVGPMRDTVSAERCDWWQKAFL
ncbi:putative carboxylesterase [Aspergillus affinis]|uniref:putative carboxylesterase n=1 Tax=Aspergillus affinis TaxID=1070780 RepID=UPI0022FED808|nr:putative carboxylesterase [Aspergillus affinis]KAI9044128.1 putative carboxylesterase [Aspergillus affinis]